MQELFKSKGINYEYSFPFTNTTFEQVQWLVQNVIQRDDTKVYLDKGDAYPSISSEALRVFPYTSCLQTICGRAFARHQEKLALGLINSLNKDFHLHLVLIPDVELEFFGYDQTITYYQEILKSLDQTGNVFDVAIRLPEQVAPEQEPEWLDTLARGLNNVTLHPVAGAFFQPLLEFCVLPTNHLVVHSISSDSLIYAQYFNQKSVSYLWLAQTEVDFVKHIESISYNLAETLRQVHNIKANREHKDQQRHQLELFSLTQYDACYRNLTLAEEQELNLQLMAYALQLEDTGDNRWFRQVATISAKHNVNLDELMSQDYDNWGYLGPVALQQLDRDIKVTLQDLVKEQQQDGANFAEHNMIIPTLLLKKQQASESEGLVASLDSDKQDDYQNKNDDQVTRDIDENHDNRDNQVDLENLDNQDNSSDTINLVAPDAVTVNSEAETPTGTTQQADVANLATTTTIATNTATSSSAATFSAASLATSTATSSLDVKDETNTSATTGDQVEATTDDRVTTTDNTETAGNQELIPLIKVLEDQLVAQLRRKQLAVRITAYLQELDSYFHEQWQGMLLSQETGVFDKTRVPLVFHQNTLTPITIVLNDQNKTASQLLAEQDAEQVEEQAEVQTEVATTPASNTARAAVTTTYTLAPVSETNELYELLQQVGYEAMVAQRLNLTSEQLQQLLRGSNQAVQLAPILALSGMKFVTQLALVKDLTQVLTATDRDLISQIKAHLQYQAAVDLNFWYIDFGDFCGSPHGYFEKLALLTYLANKHRSFMGSQATWVTFNVATMTHFVAWRRHLLAMQRRVPRQYNVYMLEDEEASRIALQVAHFREHTVENILLCSSNLDVVNQSSFDGSYKLDYLPYAQQLESATVLFNLRNLLLTSLSWQQRIMQATGYNKFNIYTSYLDSMLAFTLMLTDQCQSVNLVLDNYKRNASDLFGYTVTEDLLRQISLRLPIFCSSKHPAFATPWISDIYYAQYGDTVRKIPISGQRFNIKF